MSKAKKNSSSAKKTPAKRPSIPTELTHNHDATGKITSERSEAQVVECLVEVVSTVARPEEYGLTNVDHARDLLAGMEDGVQALARADQMREELEADAASDSDSFENEPAPAILAGHVPGSTATANQEGPKDAPLTDGQPIERGPTGNVSTPAPRSTTREKLGPAGDMAVSVRIALGHLSKFAERAQGWNVEGHGHDVTSALELGYTTTLGDLAFAACAAVTTFARALDNVQAIPNYKPSLRAASKADAELVTGQEVWLREKSEKAYEGAINVKSSLIVQKKVGSFYKVTVAEPSGLETEALIPRAAIRVVRSDAA